jgi:DNA-binding NtrC family response regulator
MHEPQPLVLMVGRESDGARALVAILRGSGLEVAWARDGEGALNALDQIEPAGLVCELHAPRIDGMTVLRRALGRNPEVCAVLVADDPTSDAAVEAFRRGAYDVQPRPPAPERLLAVMRRGLAHQTLIRRLAEAESRLDERFGIEGLTGRSRGMARVLEQVRQIAPTRAAVLLEGEPGTGKGVVAQAIHHSSPRRGERFVWLDCGALGPDVVEGELFGRERGVSEAASPQRGRVELADGGTLFLDDVAALPPPAQVRLLRVVQDRAFERVGGTETTRADVRLVASTHRDLAAAVRDGRFREDLAQRLAVVRIPLPPLRERRDDLPLLVERFVREFNREHGRKVTGVARGALERLMSYEWPGNVRELRNTLEGMIVFAEGRRALDLSDLPLHLRGAQPGEDRLGVEVGMTVEAAERRLIEATLRFTGDDKTRAAAMLGIGLRTLYRKIKQYGVR